jgi:hypothetical protein
MKLDKYIMPPEPISTALKKIPPVSNTNITASQISEAKPKYCLNACINLHETWNAYHATRNHPNGVLHKSLRSVIPTL